MKNNCGDQAISLKSYAKVNLFLEILGRRPDGFHDLVSVFQEIDLCDELTAEPAPEKTTALVCDKSDVPVDRRNLIVQAAEALREEAGIELGISFRLQKRIPLGGGLGGGSSNAAAALRLACALWQLPEEMEVLHRIAARLGSDVPFFLHGGLCLCEGRGERVTPLPQSLPLQYGMLLPPWGISTARAYKALEGQDLGRVAVDPFLNALASCEPWTIARRSYNRFEAVLEQVEPRQAELHRKLEALPAIAARMSGSGSSVWAVARKEGDMEGLAHFCQKEQLGYTLTEGRTHHGSN